MTEKWENIAQYRFIISELVMRDFKKKYSRSYLGVIWSILHPLLMMAAMALIFTQILERGVPNFPVFIFSGLLIVRFFSGSTSSGLTSLVDNKAMLIKVKIPLEIFVVVRVCGAFVDFAFAFVAYIILLIVYQVPPSPYMLFFPLVLLLLFLFALGFSFVLSVAYAYFGDIKHLWSVITRLLFWLSAIFWPIERLSGWPEFIVRANPLFVFVQSTRKAIMWQELPSFNQSIQMLAWGIVAFLIGLFIFRKNKTRILSRI
jgi:ABC-type polysaccharide/polyol phosphate export permease